MKKAILAFVSVLVLCGIASGYSQNLSWIHGTNPPPFGRSPAQPTTNDLIYFSMPTDHIFSNEWEAEDYYEGAPIIIIDPVKKEITLMVQWPPTPGLDPDDNNPVSGLEGYYGPLEEGSWFFQVQDMCTLWFDWFYVEYVEDDTGIFVIEDFEKFTDDLDAGEAIFQTWIDGIGYGVPGDPDYIAGNNTGSIVGYRTPPYAEQTIVYGGKQSMRLYYNNSSETPVSEADRYWEEPQDWTAQDVNTLVLYVHGQPKFTQTSEFPYEPKIKGNSRYLLSGAGTDIWGSSDEFRYAYKRLNGNGSITARVISNGQGSNGWAKGGVMIRESLDSGSKHGMMVITGGDGGGAAFQWRLTDNGDTQSVHNPEPPVSPPYWVKIERNLNRLTHSLSKDGVNWWSMKPTLFTNQLWDNEVYIGLCVTSHASGELRTYIFDNVSTTGNVSSQWQVEDVGVEQAGNDPEPLYVRIEDSKENTGTIVHPDPNVLLSPEWVEWKIDLGDIENDVDLTKVVKMTIGVGNQIGYYHTPMTLANPMILANSNNNASGSAAIDDIVAAGSGWGILSGYVRDSDILGRPISGAEVSLFPFNSGTSGTPVFSDSTTKDKEFYFISLVLEWYDVKVTAGQLFNPIKRTTLSPTTIVTPTDYVLTRANSNP